MFHVPNQSRIRTGKLKSDDSYGNNGAFYLLTPKRVPLMVIASDGMGWEHVSASGPGRPPLWGEMCFLKDLFWDSEDCVVQYHPPASEYVNYHPHTLHLWRPVDFPLPRPETWLVGPR